MKLKTFAALTAATMIVTACGGEKAETPVLEAIAAEAEASAPLGTLDQRLSYIVGENIATQFQRDGIKLDLEALSLSITEVQEGKELRLTEEEKRNTLSAIQERAQAAQKAELEAVSAKNTEEGQAYLAANGQKEGVVTTESGLQYKEITAGDGDKPAIEDTVTVHYKGTLVDGTVFDSSYDRGEPASFPVGGVIPGWVEALQLMNVGDKFELVVPSDLAYGPGGTGPVIGPNATLLFEVELLEVAKAEQPAAP
jgi:FKBP-type peptidyl-prolyl cis-trans isomerase FklB